MKKVLLFFVMVLLVLVSARSLFCMDESPMDYPFSYGDDSLNKIDADDKVKKKKKPKSSLNDTWYQNHGKLKEELDQLSSRDIDEQSLKNIICLLDLEIDLVRNLLDSRTGEDIDFLLRQRKKLLKRVTRTASLIYKAVMNFATNDESFFLKQKKRKHNTSMLYGAEKSAYLRRIRTVLTQYRTEFINKQYYVSQRTLGLPLDRYQQYHPVERNFGSEWMPHNVVNVNVNGGGRQSRSHVAPISGQRWNVPHYEPKRPYSVPRVYDYYYPNQDFFREPPRHNRLERNMQHFRSSFIDLQERFIDHMNRQESVVVLHDTLALVNNEIHNHVGSLNERNKMFYGGQDPYDLYTSIDAIDQKFASISPKAKMLFAAICDAATASTMSLGFWNPDIYEKNLYFYATRLEELKDRSIRMVNEFRQHMQDTIYDSCSRLENSLNGLLNDFDQKILKP